MFFFSSYGDRRDLLSFPTRRSSDLPKQDLSSVGNLAIVMGQMQSAWNRGDSEIFEIMLDQMRVNSDRKSTRLNSSHSQISYAVFCLKKKKKQTITLGRQLTHAQLHV